MNRIVNTKYDIKHLRISNDIEFKKFKKVLTTFSSRERVVGAKGNHQSRA